LGVAASVLGSLLIVLVLKQWVDSFSTGCGVASILAGILLAGFIPAWRGSQADPMVALRQD
jgi:ABC-type antimicrobial peptide transport system permease subunit